MKRFAMVALAVSAVMVLGIGIAAAQNEAPVHMFEAQGFFGEYSPNPSEFDSHNVWGGSFGWKMGPGFTFEAGISSTSFDGHFEDNRSRVDINGDVVFFDAGIDWVWFPHSLVSPTLFGGGGWAFMNVDSESSGPRVDVDISGATDDSLTLYGGIGLRVQLGHDSPFFLNGRYFYRWFDQRSSDNYDTEYSVAFGYQF